MNYNEIENLLLKYREGKCTPAEVDRIHQWYEQADSGMSQTELTDSEKSLLKSRMWTAIQHDTRPRGRTVSRWVTVRMYASIAAAAVVVSLSLVYFFSAKPASPSAAKGPLLLEPGREGLVAKSNQTSRRMVITLDDGSQVTLAPGAALTYPRRFSPGKREVQLKGDAFFSIMKDSQRPFFVYSGKLVTRVLGTSFWVKEGGDDRQMQVEVVCGKVSVFENENAEEPASENRHQFNKGVILTPNQRVTYFEESGHLMTSLVDKPVLLTSPVDQPSAIYKNVALPSIFERLEAAYGVDIVVSGEAVNECTFTGDLTDMSLFDQLDLICQSNDGSYQVQGTRILVSAAGCR
ncbi:FecR family protein [Dyadobacter fermentans]|uniref:Anti-FecI sigma factor, FecR n=1 Tax=Dyadobacter fermentans (strain ATCC 700827 / DSM 18053 / CIP 107007 / KCTC 52180 / NS114) TaxID=471854 RepID=C6VYS3_DYAFD|nr:FecR family protein [Dyadobacter fermentans]ACT93428.1 anti-FecI sigma factor, FecR [Dyadobacter fermentans DSM 18053]